MVVVAVESYSGVMYFMLVSSSEVARGRSSTDSAAGCGAGQPSIAGRRARLRNIFDWSSTVDHGCGGSSGSNGWIDYVTSHGRLISVKKLS